jgi:hypothetical protein
MATEKQWSVRIERQPHRDAVIRLRAAYRRLWSMNQALSAEAKRNNQIGEADQPVQEVSS